MIEGSSRISRHTAQILEEWFSNNLENPYPSKNVLRDLARRTCITTKKINRWLIRKRHITNKRSKIDTTILRENKRILESVFHINTRPSKEELQLLSEKTEMTPKQISIWFKNQRYRKRIQMLYFFNFWIRHFY